MSTFKQFKWAFLLALIIIGAVAFFTRDIQLVGVTLLLAVLEIGLSFDNAVVNAGTLKKMDQKWQNRFLVWGILIAVFGMRLVVPVLIVALFGGIAPWDAASLAVVDGHKYGEILHGIHAEIAGFGGMFLTMVFVNFIIEDRDIKWLVPLESFLAKFGQLKAFSAVIGIILTLTLPSLAPVSHHLSVTVAMLGGLLTYLLVDMLADRMESTEKKQTAKSIAKAGLASFIYLEVLDASFSFDGVIGAFALSSNIFIIMAGLFIGAFFVRSLTIFLVRGGHLDKLPHLEHSAHYAIAALACIMFLGIIPGVEIPEFVTGLTGAALIGLGVLTSMRHNRKYRQTA
ncbi:MAG TPA: DUF475 domain-containing protein [Candidatus Saccharimonadales bacterium]|nr:DUF475 domain-containing protein [Candidatus Saccharimonadales bacterium]